ncbi:5'-nucleotidase C-terminal domain-containing protein [Staphylococcus simulans]|uniref:5'-nucleotidase C-terminal domain-containing protein n=1 Tax=Staphylococcus simulans TaxID=1286 RepID=UPI0022B4DADA|nr:5'-nucleotidase C-terminal domain-containing protein [Staphylococcus simulans]MCD8915237.1 5'-nucleotidase C-terminal domain-containing protein [Staphylococcus simulans]
MHKLLLRTCFLVATLFLLFNITSFAAETAATPSDSTDTTVQTAQEPKASASDNAPVQEAPAETTQKTADVPASPTENATQSSTQTAPSSDSTPTAEPEVAKASPASTDTATQTTTQPADTVKPETTTAPKSQTVSQPSAQTTQNAEPDTMTASAARSTAQTDSNTAQHVKILHTNDMHGRILEEDGRVIGMSKLKTIKQQENPDLMLDSGDAFQGLPISNNTKGADMAEAMNNVGYDAMAVGNHEFDFGLDQAIKYKDQLNFPILSANTYKDGKPLFDPYTIVNKNGINYGIIGVTTPETGVKTHPNNIQGVTFTEPIPAVQNVMNQIKDQADIFIILSHLGIDGSTKTEWRGDTLANTLARDRRFSDKEIIILDGHSHSVIENGEINQNTLLAQTGTALANIGKVEFDYADNTVSNLKDSLINVKDTANVQPDPTLQQKMDEAKAKFDAQVSEVIIPDNQVQFQGERDDVRRHETNLGNAITDSMEAYAQDGFSHPADFAVTNGGGIRASIDKGKDVTLGDVITVLPFGNTISQIQVSGENVKKMFEHSLSAPVENGELGANGGFLHASKSIRVYYDINKAPGERVLKIEVLNKQTQQFEPLDNARTYYVTTNDFTAAGGDGYDMLGGPREEGISLDKVFADYLETADLSQYATDTASRIINGQPPVADTETPGVETDTPAEQDNSPAPGQSSEPAAQGNVPVVPEDQPAVAQTQTPVVNGQGNPVKAPSNVIPFPSNKPSGVPADQPAAAQAAQHTNTAHPGTAADKVMYHPAHKAVHHNNAVASTHKTAQSDASHHLPNTGTPQLPFLPIGLVLLGLGTYCVTRKADKAA